MKTGPLFLTAGVTLLTACNIQETAPPGQTGPDLCLENLRVYGADADILTVNDTLVAGLYVSNETSCNNLAGAGTRVVDLQGAHVYPGFIDAHAHLLGIGLREMTLNLEGVESIAEMKTVLAQEVRKTAGSETIYGRGWIETHWPENRFPTRQDLDQVSPDNPVILERADGHAVVANSRALQMASITARTEPPFGGDILIGKDGTPTGMLIDRAAGLVEGLIRELTPERKRAAYIRAGEVYAGYGWTGIHSMSVDPGDIPLIEELADSGELGIRVYNAIDVKGADTMLASIAANGPRRSRNGLITTRAIKLYADGALGSRGAALLAPYHDDPGNRGLMLTDESMMIPILERALRDGIQVCTHAIGDRANRLVLDWYEDVFSRIPESARKVAKPRWRIEHSQILDISDLDRFAALGVIASMQPSHAIGDLHFAVDRIGVQRLEGGYAWQSLIDSGTLIAAGSDAPVERGDPRIEFYAAVTRKDLKGFSGPGWYPGEKVTRENALEMLTKWNAYAAFDEAGTGSIEVGKQADFTIFDRNIMTIPETEILAIKPVMTIVNGKIIYDGHRSVLQ